MDRPELGPGLGLGGLDEGDHLGRNQGTVDVAVRLDRKRIVGIVGRLASWLVAGVQDQVLDDELLEGVFRVDFPRS